MASSGKFDPHGALQALDRNDVSYIVIGGFARVLQGTEEITRGLNELTSAPAIKAAARG